MGSISTRSVFYEVRQTPTIGAYFTKAFCWDCSQKVDAKGGKRKTQGGLQRFTCAGCLAKRSEKVCGA